MGYEIIYLSTLKNNLKEVAVCKTCHGFLKLSKTTLVGLATEFRIICGTFSH